TISATMSTYRSTFPTPASRANLVRSFQGNPAFESIFGLTRHLDTVAGYTAYKTLFTMTILGAVWGLLRATAFLRGEEDAGRFELLLAGPTTRGRATAQVVAGLGAGLVALWVPAALLSLAGGHSDAVGAGALGERPPRPPRLGLLGGPSGLTLRLAAPSLAAWSAALAATGLVLGLVTQSAGQSLQSSPTLERVIGRLGAGHAGAATYPGFVFLTAAALVGVA